MVKSDKLKIVIVSACYSEGMGYTENCLPKALAGLGHEVHLVCSTFNVYGNEPLYEQTYRSFLGPPRVAGGSRLVDGYTVHRLDARLIGGYVSLKGLQRRIRGLSPDIVHSMEIASLPTFALAMQKPFAHFKLFCDTHQTMSSMKPYMKRSGSWVKKAMYRLTRTIPTRLSSLVVEKCYAVTPDCGEVAVRFYGVPRSKIRFLSLGTDTDTFHPPENEHDRMGRSQLRHELGFTADDIVCIYTGRFSEEKNPLVLARAIDALAGNGGGFKALFIGDGAQRESIARCRNTKILSFMTHRDLARHYRVADIAVWPRMESMSMLDAAASGIPVVVSDRIGEPRRVEGNGLTYQENVVSSLVDVLRRLGSPEERRSKGAVGRRKMLDGFSWTRFARVLEADFRAATHGVATRE